MKEGTPVTWLFMIFILVVYVGGYIWNQKIENDRLFDIATKQKERIELLQEENEQLHTLVDRMFHYMNISPSTPPPHDISIDPEFDPIHRDNNRPL